GCVLADRLSENREVSVLLIEAGGEDTDPRISMPRGFAELLGDPGTAWHYPTRPVGPAWQAEHWVRGRTLGGSSPGIGAAASRGPPWWGWEDMLPVFRAIEDHQLGGSGLRGEGGPLSVSTAETGDPLLEDVLAAGSALGWQRVRDLNAADTERIGYTSATVRDGRRCSAARAFLHPAMNRPNLTVATRTRVDGLVLHDGRAVGVRGREGDRHVEYRAVREVILSAGALATPQTLQLSGIGPPETLRAAGVDV